jgi:Oxidoreductase molybdopterin binding domain
MRRFVRFLVFFSAAVVVFGVTAYAQKAPAAATNTFISVADDGGPTVKLDAAQLGKLKRLTLKTSDHGTEAAFEGFALMDVLKAAGVDLGEKLSGKRLSSVLVVEAADKYRAVFALPELDAAFMEKMILVADKRDRKPLAESEGPWRLVVPGEKRAARWVRQVVSIKVVLLP